MGVGAIVWITAASLIRPYRSSKVSYMEGLGLESTVRRKPASAYEVFVTGQSRGVFGGRGLCCKLLRDEVCARSRG
jgi:hypothetical protein